ncbi:EamA family transporter [Rhodoblastus acidophilus]|uniref:EamA family transporter n=1 Tax=Candidatus Rhodoblastus alkanivorans TaxID=2954117 RepID=A0ABS9Z1N6_9HYPH|nr:EamA family transporter [Candidatus Rhodoblastus alkanivorans]MCI4678537.1 EamA family transporter [Candidatus Rhodoblastus alkanivorans]MCI4681375.1 EamA family transporter [Candidatus Rhodoblastus alkanivorans]MDI4642423.1 EamA family transporter [Rhodoblastus acidophilus]
MNVYEGSWIVWALLAAIFAALTAIFAKIGVEGVDSDLATLARTVVVVLSLTLLLAATGRLQPATLSPKSVVFLVLSGLATGASWLCYFRALKLGEASQVAPIDKLSVVLVALFGAAFLGERLALVNWLGIAFIATGALLVAFR